MNSGDWIRRRLLKRFEQAAPPRGEVPTETSPSLDALMPSVIPSLAPPEGGAVDILYVRSELRELDVRLKEMTQVLEQARDRIKQETRETAALRAALEEKEKELAARTEISATEEKRASLLQQELEEVKSRLEQTAQETGNLRLSLANKDREIAELKRNTDALERYIRDKEQGLRERQLDVEKLAAQLERQKTSLPEETRKMEQEIEVLKERLSERSLNVREMLDRIQLLEQELQGEKRKNEEMSQHQSGPAPNPEEIESLRGELAERDRQLAERDRTLADQQKTIETLSQMHGGAAEQIQLLTAKSEELLQRFSEQSPGPVPVPAAVPAELTSEMEAQYRDRLGEKDRALAEAQAKASDLESQLARRTAEFDSITKTCEDLKKKNDQLESETRQLLINSQAIERMEGSLREAYRLLGADTPAPKPLPLKKPGGAPSPKLGEQAKAWFQSLFKKKKKPAPSPIIYQRPPLRRPPPR